MILWRGSSGNVFVVWGSCQFLNHEIQVFKKWFFSSEIPSSMTRTAICLRFSSFRFWFSDFKSRFVYWHVFCQQTRCVFIDTNAMGGPQGWQQEPLWWWETIDKIKVEQDHSTVMAHYKVEPKPDGAIRARRCWKQPSNLGLCRNMQRNGIGSYKCMVMQAGIRRVCSSRCRSLV